MRYRDLAPQVEFAIWMVVAAIGLSLWGLIETGWNW